MRRCSKSSEGKDFRTSHNISSSINRDEFKENRLWTLQDLRQIPERPGPPPVEKGSRYRARSHQRLWPPAAPRSDRDQDQRRAGLSPRRPPLTNAGTGRGGSAPAHCPPPAGPRGAGSGGAPPALCGVGPRCPPRGRRPSPVPSHPAPRLFYFILSVGGRGSVAAQGAGCRRWAQGKGRESRAVSWSPRCAIAPAASSALRTEGTAVSRAASPPPGPGPLPPPPRDGRRDGSKRTEGRGALERAGGSERRWQLACKNGCVEAVSWDTEGLLTLPPHPPPASLPCSAIHGEGIKAPFPRRRAPPAPVREAVAAPVPAALTSHLTDWREDGGGGPRLPALLLAAACVCAAGRGTTKEKGETGGYMVEGGACVCTPVGGISGEEKTQGQEAVLLHGRRRERWALRRTTKRRGGWLSAAAAGLPLGSDGAPGAEGAGGGSAGVRREGARRGRREGSGGFESPWLDYFSSGEAAPARRARAALPSLPAAGRAAAHGPRGDHGPGQRGEESGSCPRAAGRLETLPLVLLLLLLLLAPGCEQLAALLRLHVPGPLCPGVPVQVLRQNLLLLGSLCQLHLCLRPGLGGRPVPTLPGQVQVSLYLLQFPFSPPVIFTCLVGLFFFLVCVGFFIFCFCLLRFCSCVVKVHDRSQRWNRLPHLMVLLSKKAGPTPPMEMHLLTYCWK